ncbi:MAG: S-methyl-5-thioribose-1-phosphate isomerase [Phycisphaerales bacterium]|nr:S-methyl-5-thioribose-1-phosphate isomerase [Phycisphaerales bacterium]
MTTISDPNPTVRLEDFPADVAAPAVGQLPPTIAWRGGERGLLELLDQTLLPGKSAIRSCRTKEDVWQGIRDLAVRGAPAIGVAAAYGVVIGARAAIEQAREGFLKNLDDVGNYLRTSRPTAVNLGWAVDRMTRVARDAASPDGASIWRRLLAEAHVMLREDAAACRKIGEHGAAIIPDGGGVLTHCNAGALATVAYGTATAPMYVAHEQGRKFRVFVDETRPLLQGSRLTAFELAAAGMDVVLQCDSAAASLLRSGAAQAVIVGADRIAANGDVANKIGTYSVALAAHRHSVPFYVAAPRSTFDLTLPSGDAIPIEERAADEVRGGFGALTAPAQIACRNPAFDVTPAELVTAIITEVGIVKPVSRESVARIFD